MRTPWRHIWKRRYSSTHSYPAHPSHSTLQRKTPHPMHYLKCWVSPRVSLDDLKMWNCPWESSNCPWSYGP
jgi:hypothetical protein